MYIMQLNHSNPFRNPSKCEKTYPTMKVYAKKHQFLWGIDTNHHKCLKDSWVFRGKKIEMGEWEGKGISLMFCWFLNWNGKIVNSHLQKGNEGPKIQALKEGSIFLK